MVYNSCTNRVYNSCTNRVPFVNDDVIIPSGAQKLLRLCTRVSREYINSSVDIILLVNVCRSIKWENWECCWVSLAVLID